MYNLDKNNVTIRVEPSDLEIEAYSWKASAMGDAVHGNNPDECFYTLVKNLVHEYNSITIKKIIRKKK